MLMFLHVLKGLKSTLQDQNMVKIFKNINLIMCYNMDVSSLNICFIQFMHVQVTNESVFYKVK
jgi:uncharacterized protein YunC (DUF1805 family)